MYKFQGCQFKPHIPRTVLPAEASIQKTVERLSDLICNEPPPPLCPPDRALARVLSLSNGAGAEGPPQPVWWRSLALIPPEPRPGLLHAMRNRGEYLT